ncbi:hypothetical protein PVAR5_6940 [Paecilomyces variotii No. 5]|uniref:NAD-dependent epimerase/dehydratase domain-containing protein n=1 Tax=Byssochlamys spectabilis (strain No. 5 / NBRC 109023) TaxID=1356009 RepID=V5FK49_BYSSN|nr:hypothetical protein PVAR5_6940 [Paecilomyces variotii No. 5]
MRVFITGAAGFIGRAVVNELLEAGHTIVGLARSEASAKWLQNKGIEVIRGTIEDTELLKRAASESDGVIHLAFDLNFSKFVENARVSNEAIRTFGATFAGSNRPLVLASGTIMIQSDPIATEDSECDMNNPINVRGIAEEEISRLASQGVRGSVVRLPPTVHSDDDHGFIYMIGQVARTKGVSVYVGDGHNRWPAGHRSDAARLFRLALEKGTPGARYHAVGEEGVAMKDIADALGQALGVPTVSKTPEEASEHLGGFMAHVIGIDNPSSSKKTQEQLGWTPTGRTLLEDIKAGAYTN